MKRILVVELLAVAALSARLSGAAPLPNYPALAILRDPNFIPVALTGSGFGTSGAGSSLTVQSDTTTVTIPSTQLCASNAPPCILFWDDDGLAAKLQATMTKARVQVTVGASSSEYIRAQYYTYSYVKPLAGFPEGLPLAIAVNNNAPPLDDALRRVWIDSEVHTYFKVHTPGQSGVAALSLNHPTPGPFYRGGQSNVSLGGEDAMVDPRGRAWLNEGGDGPPPAGGGNYSRIVMYDPADLTHPRIYNLPGNDTEIYGFTYQKDFQPGRDRVWYTARARQGQVATILPARIGWFDPEDPTIYNDGTVAFVPTAACPPNSCAGNVFQSCCADNTSRNCGDTTDCAITSRVCWWNELGTPGHPSCKFVEYPMEPLGTFPHFGGPTTAYVAHLAVAPNGIVWAADYWGQSALIRLDPVSGAVTRYPLGDDPARGPSWLLGSAPWELQLASNGDVLVNEYADVTINRFHVDMLGAPGACESLVNGQNPCVTALNVPGPTRDPMPNPAPPDCTMTPQPNTTQEAPTYYTQHTIRLDARDNLWFGLTGSETNPGSRATIGYVKRDWKSIVLFPPLTIYPLDPNEVVCTAAHPYCFDPCYPGPMAAQPAGMAVDRATEDVWFADYDRIRLGRLRPSTTNLALGRAATQSSTWLPPQGDAAHAVDGDIDGDFNDGSVAHTFVGDKDWWQVDLGDSYFLEEVELWNRTDCCSDRLQNFYIFISDVPFSSNDPAVTAGQQHVKAIQQTAAVGRRFSAAVNRTGRYVRVQLATTGQPLQLAEVVVLGSRCTTGASCDDGNVCTNDSCNPSGGCSHGCRYGEKCVNGCTALCQDVAGACTCVAQ